MAMQVLLKLYNGKMSQLLICIQKREKEWRILNTNECEVYFSLLEQQILKSEGFLLRALQGPAGNFDPSTRE